MTDKELLEKAAKAAGIDAEFHSELGYGPEGMWLKGARSPDNNKYWNPLNSDGDALRLAVKLKLHLAIEAESAGIIGAMWNHDESGTPQNIIEEDAPLGGDDYAATRRAIVRAAAAIGNQR